MSALRTLMLALMLLSTASIAVVSNPAHAEVKIAVVNFQIALDKVKEGEAARKKLEGLYEQKRKSIQSMEAALQSKATELDKQRVLLSKEALEVKERELYAEQMRFQQTYMQSEQEMQLAYAEVMDGLVQKMKIICAEIGAEKGYTVILELGDQGVLMGAGGVVFAGTGATDITNDLVSRYNAKNPG